MPRVRKDSGYPPLVTPTSQIVGSQAVFNVLIGKYKVLTGEFADLMLGYYGSTIGEKDPESKPAGPPRSGCGYRDRKGPAPRHAHCPAIHSRALAGFLRLLPSGAIAWAGWHPHNFALRSSAPDGPLHGRASNPTPAPL